MAEELAADMDAHVAGAGPAGARIADADEFSLSHEFYDAYKAFRKHLKAEDAAPEQADLDALSSKLKAIAVRVGQLRLFSKNEELDDISTADLKFLLLPHLLGDTVAATRQLEDRPQALRRALIFWRGFCADCQRLKIAHDDDCLAIDRGPEDRLDARAKRDEKIARYRRSKELDEKAEYLFKKKREVVGDELQWGHGGAFDEDMERELILSLLGRAVASAVEDIDSAEQELPLLEMMAARGGPGALKEEKPLPAEKPFIVRIQDKAELMRLYNEMVFQCPHARPTMTLEEHAEIEMDQMRERQESQSAQMREQRAEEDDRWFHGDRVGAQEQDDEDRKYKKDQDWDDWKDAHPWGSGNKMTNMG